ncbi:MAG: hypothetical protein M3Y59_15150 [Myxococcota bacterium]|nr:hypothetical protein [Myxococcota bacterium]
MRRLAGALLLVVTGCAQLPAPLTWEAPQIGERPSPADDLDKERAFRQVQERYSDQAEVYAQLDTRMFVGATFQSWPFREAKVRYLAGFEKLPAVRVEQRLAEEKTQHQEAHEFFVGAHLNDYRYDDFDKSSSTWRVVLISNGLEIEPLKVERVGRSNLAMRSVYPYMDEFWTAYRFKFARKTKDGVDVIPAGTQKVTLRLASTLGQAELEFPAE